MRMSILANFVARPRLAAALLLGIGLIILACSDTNGGREVRIALNEWAVTPAVDEVSSGQLRFVVVNNGTRAHELIVVKSDLLPGELPSVDGRLDASRVNVEQTAATSRVEPGATVALEFALSDGKYVLLCNLIEPAGASGRALSHYENGMYASFFVRQEP